MFPTTIWTTIRQAAEDDDAARERFAALYLAPVTSYVKRRGMSEHDSEDLAQDVFVKLFRSDLLSRADRDKGRFRSLLLTVTKRVVQDRLRKKTATPVEDLEIVERDEEFDREWVTHLLARSLERLREDGSPYYQVLKDHLAGHKKKEHTRNQLWIARRKLLALIRHEVALTCSSHADLEDELEYLSHYLKVE